MTDYYRERTVVPECGTTAHTVKARQRHRCGDRSCRPEPGVRGCTGWIEKGERYARLVAFPNADFMSGTRPWIMRVCEDCYIQTHPTLPKRTMRKRRTDAVPQEGRVR